MSEATEEPEADGPSSAEQEEGDDTQTQESAERESRQQDQADAVPEHSREGLDETAFSEDDEDEAEAEPK